MRRPTRAAWVTIAMAGVAPAMLPSSGAAAQLPGIITPACRETCPNPLEDPVGAAACAARQQACTTKIDLYKTYMLQLGAGTAPASLTATYADVLQPFFAGADLRSWRFAFGDRQPANNATTDCGITYFNNQSVVNDLRTGRLDEDSEFAWLLHELRHYAQCTQLGGRDAYAKMWFGHLELAFLQTNGNLGAIHDEMIMEGDAATTAMTVLGRIAAMRDRSGRLVRPISVALEANGNATGSSLTALTGTPVRLTARTTGGSTPLDFSWTYKRPGESVWRSASAIQRDDHVVELTPDRIGTYEVRVRVGQAGATLTPATARIAVRVSSSPVVARTTPVTTTPARTVSTRPLQPRGTLTVQVVQRRASGRGTSAVSGATVTVGTSARDTWYGSRTTDRSGVAEFAGMPLSAAQRLTISARSARCASRPIEATLTELAQTVRVEVVCR